MPTTKNPRFELGQIEDLTLGLSVDGSAVNAPPGSADMAENLLFTEDGSLRARPGVRPLYTLPVDVAEPLLIDSVQIGSSERIVAVTPTKVILDGVTLSPSLQGTPKQVVSMGQRAYVVTDTNLYEITGSGVTSPTAQLGAFLAQLQEGGTMTAGTYEYSYTLIDPQGIETGVLARQAISIPTGQYAMITLGNISSAYVTIKVYRKDPGSVLPLLLTTIPIDDLSMVYHDLGGTTLAGLTPPNRKIMGSGQMACISGGRLWTVADNILSYSEVNTPYVSGNFAVEPFSLPDGGRATAIAPFNQGVVIFGLNTALYVSGPPSLGGTFLPLALSDGCINAQCWTQVDGQLAFVGKEGIYILQNANGVLISKGTQKLVRSVDRANACLAYSPRRQLLSLSMGVRLFTLQFRAGTPRAAFWSFPGPASSYPQTTYNGELVYYRSRRMLMFDAENDEGVRINCAWRSNPVSFGAPHLWKMMRRAEAQFLSNGTFTASLSVGEAFGDGTPDAGTSQLSASQAGGKWDVGKWDEAKWGSENAELTARLSTPTDVQGNYIRLRVDFQPLEASTMFVSAPIRCEFRTRERLGRN